MIQATEILKLVLDGGNPLIGRLLLYDAMKMSFKEVRVQKDPECLLCGENPSVKNLIDYNVFCNIPSLETEKPDEINNELFELSPSEFKEAIDNDPSGVLVDVREKFEWDICKLEGALLLPLSNFNPSISGLKKENTIYIYCYKGQRSMLALKELKKAGFNKLKSLRGGIDSWAEEVDQKLPQY